jgi:hypothetical protein
MQQVALRADAELSRLGRSDSRCQLCLTCDIAPRHLADSIHTGKAKPAHIATSGRPSTGAHRCRPCSTRPPLVSSRASHPSPSPAARPWPLPLWYLPLRHQLVVQRGRANLRLLQRLAQRDTLLHLRHSAAKAVRRHGDVGELLQFIQV